MRKRIIPIIMAVLVAFTFIPAGLKGNVPGSDGLVYAGERTVKSWNELENAINYASSGDTIRIACDLAATKTLNIDKKLTFTTDGNKRTIYTDADAQISKMFNVTSTGDATFSGNLVFSGKVVDGYKDGNSVGTIRKVVWEWEQLKPGDGTARNYDVKEEWYQIHNWFNSSTGQSAITATEQKADGWTWEGQNRFMFRESGKYLYVPSGGTDTAVGALNGSKTPNALAKDLGQNPFGKETGTIAASGNYFAAQFSLEQASASHVHNTADANIAPTFYAKNVLHGTYLKNEMKAFTAGSGVTYGGHLITTTNKTETMDGGYTTTEMYIFGGKDANKTAHWSLVFPDKQDRSGDAVHGANETTRWTVQGLDGGDWVMRNPGPSRNLTGYNHDIAKGESNDRKYEVWQLFKKVKEIPIYSLEGATGVETRHRILTTDNGGDNNSGYFITSKGKVTLGDVTFQDLHVDGRKNDVGLTGVAPVRVEGSNGSLTMNDGTVFQFNSLIDKATNAVTGAGEPVLGQLNLDKNEWYPYDGLQIRTEDRAEHGNFKSAFSKTEGKDLDEERQHNGDVLYGWYVNPFNQERDAGRTAGAAIIADGAKGTMSEGVAIKGNRALVGGVLVEGKGSEFTMNGGKVERNEGLRCGGVFADNEAKFVMTKGLFGGNLSWSQGGAIRCSTFATITVGTKDEDTGKFGKASDCRFLNNTAYWQGGALFVGEDDRNGSTATLHNGEFAYNTARTMGGALYVAHNSDALLKIAKGAIYHNQATWARYGGVNGTDAHGTAERYYAGTTSFGSDKTNNNGLGAAIHDFNEGQPFTLEERMQDATHKTKEMYQMGGYFSTDYYGHTMNDTRDDAPYSFHSGTGGGVWTCPSGSTLVDLGAVSIHHNDAAHGGDDFHKDLGLGGGAVANLHPGEWNYDNTSIEGDIANEPQGAFSGTNAAKDGLNLRSVYSDTDFDAIAAKNKYGADFDGVLIHDNASRRGGGLGSNGSIIFGIPKKEREYTEDAMLRLEKKWNTGVKNAKTEKEVRIEAYLPIEVKGSDTPYLYHFDDFLMSNSNPQAGTYAMLVKNDGWAMDLRIPARELVLTKDNAQALKITPADKYYSEDDECYHIPYYEVANRDSEGEIVGDTGDSLGEASLAIQFREIEIYTKDETDAQGNVIHKKGDAKLDEKGNYIPISTGDGGSEYILLDPGVQSATIKDKETINFGNAYKLEMNTIQLASIVTNNEATEVEVIKKWRSRSNDVSAQPYNNDITFSWRNAVASITFYLSTGEDDTKTIGQDGSPYEGAFEPALERDQVEATVTKEMILQYIDKVLREEGSLNEEKEREKSGLHLVKDGDVWYPAYRFTKLPNYTSKEIDGVPEGTEVPYYAHDRVTNQSWENIHWVQETEINADGSQTVINQESINIKAEKKWLDGNNGTWPSGVELTVSLKREIETNASNADFVRDEKGQKIPVPGRDGYYKAYADLEDVLGQDHDNGDPSKKFNNQKLTAGNSTVTWVGLPKYDTNGKPIKYTLKEEGVPNGYMQTGAEERIISDITYLDEANNALDGKDRSNATNGVGTLTLRNTESTEIKVEKKWDTAHSDVDDLWVLTQLYSGTSGQTQTPYANQEGDQEYAWLCESKPNDSWTAWNTLLKDGLVYTKDNKYGAGTEKVHMRYGEDWTYTWSNLPKYSADEKEISYSVTEIGVTAWTSWVETRRSELTGGNWSDVYAKNSQALHDAILYAATASESDAKKAIGVAYGYTPNYQNSVTTGNGVEVGTANYGTGQDTVRTVVITNVGTGKYELPSAGGSGVYGYIVGGIALLSIGGLMFLRRRVRGVM